MSIGIYCYQDSRFWNRVRALENENIRGNTIEIPDFSPMRAFEIIFAIQVNRMDEKRKYKRIPTTIKSEVHFDDGMTFSKSMDLSKGGLFISTPEPLNVGSEVSLSLQIPGEDPVDIKGVVKWVRESVDMANSESEKIGMGIEFSTLSEPELKRLRKLTEQQ